MGDWSEQEFLRHRTTQTKNLENLQIAVATSGGSSNSFTVCKAAVANYVLKFCKTVKTSVNEVKNINKDELIRRHRNKIAAAFASIRGQTSQLFQSMERDVMKASENLDEKEQGFLADIMQKLANAFETLCDMAKLIFKIIMGGMTFLYNKVKESFLEFVDILEKAISPTAPGSALN